MKHRTSFLLFIGLLLLGSAPLQACAFVPPPMYSAEAIEAWVVDEQTGHPLDGVVVVAHWALRGGVFSKNTIGQLMILETVTDAKGRFAFPAWGPKLRPVTGFLHNRDPAILLFKTGYHPRGLENDATEQVNTSAVRRSEWNGKTIKFKKFEGSLAEYARRLIFFDTDLGFIQHGRNCEWKEIPRLLMALDQQEKSFRDQKVAYSLLSIDYLPDQDKCGSAREYFRSYRP
jgi:hypothetical protein